MKLIFTYLSDHELTLNVDKTKMLTFSSPQICKIVSSFNFQLNDVRISNAEYLKCLGLYLDPFLKFNVHVERMS